MVMWSSYKANYLRNIIIFCGIDIYRMALEVLISIGRKIHIKGARGTERLNLKELFC